MDGVVSRRDRAGLILQGAEFDFVVVGAGSSGCVLAERLTADGRHRVALVEAGGSDLRFWVQTPLGYGKTFHDPSLTWPLRTEPDPGLAGRTEYWPRGKVLGGSSSINAMVWIRGAPRDYDDWAAAGATGWGWADVAPVFRAIEDCEGGADEWRGAGGPVHVSDPARFAHPLARRFVQAGMEAGLPFNPDFNGASQEGVGIYRTTIKGGRRMSAARAFLRPALRRANLAVLTRAHACRVLFEGRRAVGVEIDRGGRREVLRARREVILSAGSIGSPGLLERSGVGDGARLRALGIDTALHAPAVGEHLQDHLGINYVYRSREPSLNERLRPWSGKLVAGLDYLLRRRGPLALSLNQGGGFARTRPGLDRPNVQLYLQAITTFTARQGERPLLTPDPFPGFALGLSNCSARSRGRIHIVSPDPHAPPRIEPNGLSDPLDVQDALEGVKLLRRLAAQPALRDAIVEELQPGPAARTDEELIADFRARCGTVYHPCATCRIGPEGPGAVVDPRLRVHGAEGLRVIDASVFPSVIVGNTNAAAIMTGAKGAAMVLEDAR